MGTNFYAVVNLGGPEVKLHIGKSSIGWCFGLAVNEGITSLADWRRVFAQAFVRIVDEYGVVYGADEMLGLIENRGFLWAHQRDSAWYADNHAAPGPNGLARHTHKAALPPNPATDTYDLCRGDFS